MMAKQAALSESPVTLRLPVDILERLDALGPAIAADADTAAILGGVSRSSVSRLAIVEGLRLLNRHYQDNPRGKEVDLHARGNAGRKQILSNLRHGGNADFRDTNDDESGQTARAATVPHGLHTR